MPNDHDIVSKRHGHIPSEDDLFWPEAMRRVQVDVMPGAHAAAGRVLTLDAIAWVVGVLVLAWRTTPEWVPSPTPSHQITDILLGIVPLLLWSGSAVFALRVFTVRRYRYFANSPDSTREGVIRIARRKLSQLYWAIGLWSAGVLMLIVTILYGRA